MKTSSYIYKAIIGGFATPPTPPLTLVKPKLAKIDPPPSFFCWGICKAFFRGRPYYIRGVRGSGAPFRRYDTYVRTAAVRS